MLLGLHRAFQAGSRIQDGPNDLIVTGAAAEITGQPAADLSFSWVWVPVEQRLGCHDETWSADTALQSCMFQKFLLEHMEPFFRCDTFDCGNRFAIDFNCQDQARVYQYPIHYDVTSAAVAIVTPQLGPGEAKHVAQYFQQALPGLAAELDCFIIDIRMYKHL